MKPRTFIKRVFILLITLCMIFSLFSCTVSESVPGESAESTDNLTDDAWYKDLNFRGTTLTVSMSVNVWDKSSMMDSQAKFTRGPKEIGADEVLNACYSRNREVESLLGLNVRYNEVDYNYLDVNPYLDSIAMMAKAPADLIVNDIYAVCPAMLKGQLYNLKDETEENYFNFEHSSWYSEFMNGLTYDESRVYAAAGDYFIDVLRWACVLYVNTEIFQIQLSDYFCDMKEFYTTILDGGWNYDVYMTLIEQGWKSTSGKPYANENDEYIGLWTRNAAMGSVYCTGVSMTEKTADGYVIKQDTKEFQKLAEALAKLYNYDGVYRYNEKNDSYCKQKFAEGQILFLADFWLGDLEYSTILGMESKAPIVYPKWNETAEYHTWIQDNAEIGYILTNVSNFTPTSAYLQLLNEQSEEITSYYYEYTLKYAKNTDPDVVEILDLIRDVIISPFDQFLSGAPLHSAINNTISTNNPPRDRYRLPVQHTDLRGKIAR